MLFDSHTHLNNEDFTEEEIQERIAEIEADDELKFVADIGFDFDSSVLAVEHARKYPWCYAAVGWHPHDAKSMPEQADIILCSLASDKKVVAIGEIGLDYHYDISPRDVQREAFRRQLKVAKGLGIPVVVHSREADKDTFDILCEEGMFDDDRTALFPERPVPAGWENCAKDARILIHCFSGSAELAKEYMKKGAWISVGGTLTFKNNKKTVRVVSEIPTEFILSETDSPFLTPEPFRGRPNKSSYVKYVVEKVAEIRGEDKEFVEKQMFENCMRFYGIEE